MPAGGGPARPIRPADRTRYAFGVETLGLALWLAAAQGRLAILATPETARSRRWDFGPALESGCIPAATAAAPGPLEAGGERNPLGGAQLPVGREGVVQARPEDAQPEAQP